MKVILCSLFAILVAASAAPLDPKKMIYWSNDPLWSTKEYPSPRSGKGLDFTKMVYWTDDVLWSAKAHAVSAPFTSDAKAPSVMPKMSEVLYSDDPLWATKVEIDGVVPEMKSETIPEEELKAEPTAEPAAEPAVKSDMPQNLDTDPLWATKIDFNAMPMAKTDEVINMNEDPLWATKFDFTSMAADQPDEELTMNNDPLWATKFDFSSMPALKTEAEPMRVVVPEMIDTSKLMKGIFWSADPLWATKQDGLAYLLTGVSADEPTPA